MRCSLLVLAATATSAGALTQDKLQSICNQFVNKTITIGAVTKGNVELTLDRFRPTFETFLTASLQELGYNCYTRLVPLSFDNYREKTMSAEIDIIFPNPTAFQEMKDEFGVREFLSITRNFGDNQRLDRFGGVIVRHAEKFTDVIEMADIKKHPGMKVCAVNANAFGGWHIQWYELIKSGIDISTDVEVEFLKGHEIAINATITQKRCDIGIARTETVERLIDEGWFGDGDVFTLGSKSADYGFPQRLSTELYPEWPLAALQHVPREIEQILAVPLLNIKPTSNESIIGKYYGWAFPYSYQPVKDMFIAIAKIGYEKCLPGEERVGTNPGSCEKCQPGFFNEPGTASGGLAADLICRPCPIGTFNSGSGNLECDFCPSGLTTYKEGSVDGECTEGTPWVLIVTIISGVLGSIFIAAGVLVCMKLYRTYKSALKSAEEDEIRKRERLKKAVNTMQQFEFPLCVMPFNDFRSLGQLVAHEEARGRGILKWCDVWDEAVVFAEEFPIVFNSHQWLSIETPDPDGTHYRSMLTACMLLSESHNIDLRDLYIWVDFHSIPQACTASKLRAIQSIMVYASCSKYFIIVAPLAKHVSRNERCDTETYRRRGWCRLEQWSFMITGGLDRMYVLDGDATKGDPSFQAVTNREGWLVDMINVMDGDFSVDSDKFMLVDVILGLYGFAMICGKDFARRRFSTRSSRSKSSLDVTSRHRSIVFPATYFKGMDTRLEKEIEFAIHHVDDSTVPAMFNEKEIDTLMAASQAFTRIHESEAASPMTPGQSQDNDRSSHSTSWVMPTASEGGVLATVSEPTGNIEESTEKSMAI